MLNGGTWETHTSEHCYKFIILQQCARALLKHVSISKNDLSGTTEIVKLLRITSWLWKRSHVRRFSTKSNNKCLSSDLLIFSYSIYTYVYISLSACVYLYKFLLYSWQPWLFPPKYISKREKRCCHFFCVVPESFPAQNVQKHEHYKEKNWF